MYLISIIKAKINKVPYSIKEHWLQYYAMGYKYKKDESLECIIFDNYAREGRVVDVFKRGNIVHKYTITNTGLLKGGDWGPYANNYFDLVYHSSVKSKA
jgi:hypothetical protein